VGPTHAFDKEHHMATQITDGPLTRTHDGVELPQPGLWRIDPGHAEVGFVGRHFMLTKVRGRFEGVRGELHIAEDPSSSSLVVEIDMASVSSGSTDRDDHLRSSDFFDVTNFPLATFRSTAITWNGTSGTVDGDLTLVGVTRPVQLDAEFRGAVRDLGGSHRAVFAATGELDREDWGLTWNQALEAGGLLVSKRVRLEIEVETVREA
jgi:polyisoprenoid-binding protein YceI